MTDITIPIKITKDTKVHHSVQMMPEYACCEDPAYKAPQVKHHKGKISCFDTTVPLRIYIFGGCPPYTWSVPETSILTFDEELAEAYTEITSDDYNDVYVWDCDNVTDPAGDPVTITDSCGNSVMTLVRRCDGGCSDDGRGGGGGPGETRCDGSLLVCPEDMNDPGAYVPPSIKKDDEVYDYYLVGVTVTKVLDVNTVRTTRMFNSSHHHLNEGITDRFVVTAWKRGSDGDVVEELAMLPGNYGSGGYISDFSYFEDQATFTTEHEMEVGDGLIYLTRGLICDCKRQSMYTISGGVPPFNLEENLGSGWSTTLANMDHCLFGWYGYAGDCDGTAILRVTDACGVTSDEIRLGFREREGALLPTKLSAACGERINIAVETLEGFCDGEYFLELIGAGTLTASYDSDFMECQAGNPHEAESSRRKTVEHLQGGSWTAPDEVTCCPQAASTVNMYVCPIGSSSMRLVDSVTFTTILRSDLEFDPAFSPVDLTAPTNDIMFKVTGGKGPYTWTLEVTQYGESMGLGFTWDEVTTSIPQNTLDVSGIGCGSALLRCTDQCTSVAHEVRCTTSGTWVLIAEDEPAHNPIASIGFPKVTASAGGHTTYESIYKAVEYATSGGGSCPSVSGGPSDWTMERCCPLMHSAWAAQDLWPIPESGFHSYYDPFMLANPVEWPRAGYPTWCNSLYHDPGASVGCGNPTGDWEAEPCMQYLGSHVMKLLTQGKLFLYEWRCP